jgi:AcrR family transcriptional regulator
MVGAMSAPKSGYHHGDLRSALLQAALELLEDGGGAELSLRAVARRAGVSTAAPYRHYADREALVSAVAGVGYRELAGRLAAVHPAPATVDDVVEVAVAYVRFALDRPALFRIMFEGECDREDDERIAAVAAVSLYVRSIVERTFPDADPDALTTATWGLVHGLAVLHLDGKLPSDPHADVDARVRAAVRTLAAPLAAGTPASS